MLLMFILPVDLVNLSYCSNKIQLTSDMSVQDRPSLIFAPATPGFPDRYYLAYQSWETGYAYGGDIFIEMLDLSWNSIKKVRATSEASYQDIPSLVYDGAHVHVLYVSNETGSYNIFVKTYDNYLNLLYKKQLTDLPYLQDHPSAVLVMGEYFYVAYQSWETGMAYHGDIFIEVFDLSWDSIIKVRVTNETSYQDSPSICQADHSICVAYVSSETGYLDIFLKKYDLYLESETKFRLTTEPCTHDSPSLNTVNTSTYEGFSLAYQSWESGEANHGDIFVKHFGKSFSQIDKTQVTNDEHYQDSPCITPETPGRPAHVAYVSDETGNWDIFVSSIEPAATRYMLTIPSTVGGTTDPPPGNYIYDQGTTVQVTALPLAGYKFDHWEKNGVIYPSLAIEVLMDRNYTLKAVFSKITYPFDEDVVRKIIVPKNLTTDLIAYRWNEPLKADDIIEPSVPEPGHEHRINRTSWLYWLNDCPYSMFAHKTRYVLIDNVTGNMETYVEGWPPALNGKQLWATPKDFWNPQNWVYSTVTNYSQSSMIHGTSRLLSRVEFATGSTRNLEAQSSKRVLIIEGFDSTGFFDNASELCYSLMTGFGYSDEEIVYLAREAREKADAISTKENVFTAIRDLSNNLSPGDDLTLFIFAHGCVEEDNKTGYIEPADIEPHEPSTLLYDYELNKSLSQITGGVHINAVIESCYGGSFMDDLWSLKDVENLISSTDWKSVSYLADFDPPINYQFVANLTADPNPSDEGGEFSSGLIQGLNELRQSFVNGSLTIGELYVRAFKEAKQLDAGYINHEKLAAPEAYNSTEMKPNPLMNTIFFEGDINHDGTVDIVDVSKAAMAFGSKAGNQNWDPEADVDKSTEITIFDISVIAMKFGTVYYYVP